MTFFLAMAVLLSPSSTPVSGSDASAIEAPFHYQSLSDTSLDVSRISIDVAGKELIYPATVTQLDTCPGQRAGCFQSTHMSFCAPTETEVLAGAWNCGSEDLQFRLTGRLTLHVLGSDVATLVISGRGVDYFYSRERGIVMFRFSDQPIAEVYWSVGARGFGGDPNTAAK